MSDSDVIGIHSEVITGAVFFKNETTGMTEHMEVLLNFNLTFYRDKLQSAGW